MCLNYFLDWLLGIFGESCDLFDATPEVLQSLMLL